jgi:hypothetical protein
MRDFFHDVPTEVTAAAFAGPPPGEQSDRLFADPWPLDRWPHVPTRMLQGVDDRFFLLEFQRRIVRERLGLELDEMPGGHHVALSQPEKSAPRLDNPAAEVHFMRAGSRGDDSKHDQPYV